MTKLKPHEIFIAGMICGSCWFYLGDDQEDYFEDNENEIKKAFFEFTGIKWPGDISVVDCWKKVVADEKLR